MLTLLGETLVVQRLNNDNELIGIPTEGRGVGEGAGVLGALRPVNLALDLIEDARDITGKK